MTRTVDTAGAGRMLLGPMLSHRIRRRPKNPVLRAGLFVVRLLRLALMIVVVGPARGLGAGPKAENPDVRDHPEETARETSPAEAPVAIAAPGRARERR